MAELSTPWPASGGGDAGSYSDDQWSDIWRQLFNTDRATQGILRASVSSGLNELVVSGVASPVAIASGIALVDGKFYRNSASVNKTISTPATGLDRIDRIVLRKDFAGQTVRVTVITGTPAGSPSAPSITQNDGVTWDLPLAQVYITDAGTITITDEREWNRSLIGLVQDRGVAFVFDNAGAELETGVQFSFPIPINLNLRLKGWMLCAPKESGDVVLDIWYEADASVGGLPADGDSICNSNEPELSAAQYAEGLDLIGDGWTLDISGGGLFIFNVDSVTDITNCTLTLFLETR